MWALSVLPSNGSNLFLQKGITLYNFVNFLLLWPLSPVGCPKGLFWVLYSFRDRQCPWVPFLRNTTSPFYCFADDLQICLPLKPYDLDSLQPFINCLSDLKTRPELIFLFLNENKTNIAVFGHSDQLMAVLALLARYGHAFDHLHKIRA